MLNFFLRPPLAVSSSLSAESEELEGDFFKSKSPLGMKDSVEWSLPLANELPRPKRPGRPSAGGESISGEVGAVDVGLDVVRIGEVGVEAGDAEPASLASFLVGRLNFLNIAHSFKLAKRHSVLLSACQ